MENWIRAERWILVVIGVCLFASIALAMWPRPIEPPIRELGEPIYISQGRASTIVVYEVDRPYPEVWRDLDVQLQVKGFLSPSELGTGRVYRRHRRDSVRVYQGTWRQNALDQWRIETGDGSKTTVVYTIYRDSWWRVWRKVNRDWQWSMQEKQRQSRSSSP